MSSTDNLVTTNTEIAGVRVKGVCKWFNNKSGYGFLTVTEGEKKDMDIFVHHSSLHVGNEEQYKYLVQGEYVDFTISNIDKSDVESKHEFHGTNVTGVNGGKLMCETRNEIRASKPKTGFKPSSFFTKKSDKQDNLEKRVESTRDDSEKNEWVSVKSKTLGNVNRGRGRPKKEKNA
jgi:cold shock CspA family protein